MTTHAPTHQAATPLTGTIITPMDALEIIREMTSLAREWIQVHETESTKRAEIIAAANVGITEIRERRDLFLNYLDRSFDERAHAFRELLASLDKALQHTPDAVGPILASITTLALRSPFADLHDPALLRSKWDDPDAVWEQ